MGIKKSIGYGVAFFLLLPILQSCFTGVEGTSKINLSKRDINATAPSEEDLFLSDIKKTTVELWKPGKEFLVTDEKFRFITEGNGNNVISSGDTIRYLGAEERYGAGGDKSTAIVFESHGDKLYYVIENSKSNVESNITVSDIPMLIDLEMVESVRAKLTGQKFWTKTASWYDSDLNFQKGKKFTEIRVTDVKPGNSFFPLLVIFKDQEGVTGRLLMNYGGAGNESRSFARLFSLTDPKKNYKHITEDHWAAIQKEGLILGMTKEECKLSRGNPSDVDTGHSYSSAMEIWYYPDGSYLRFVDGLLVSYK